MRRSVGLRSRRIDRGRSDDSELLFPLTPTLSLGERERDFAAISKLVAPSKPKTPRDRLSHNPLQTTRQFSHVRTCLRTMEGRHPCRPVPDRGDRNVAFPAHRQNRGEGQCRYRQWGFRKSLKALIVALSAFLICTVPGFGQGPIVDARLSSDDPIWVGQKAALVVELKVPGFFSGTPAHMAP